MMWLREIANNTEKKFVFLLVIILFAFMIYNADSVLSWGHASNYENVSVRTTVNITNAYPEILAVTCDYDNSVILTAGTIKNVSCLVELRDYNSGDDIDLVNAFFYYNLNQSTDPDNNNVHYTNASCDQEGVVSGYYVNYSCDFDVWYYAKNGTWYINVTVNDSYGSEDNTYDSVTITELLALNVTNVIDFGQMYVGQTSASPIEANITNFGNVPINVSVYGFGGDDSLVAGATSVAMFCEVRNITMHNERYSLVEGTLYDSMTPITGSSITIPDLQLQKQTQPGVQIINSTYWRLHINVTTNPFGVCNGTVVYSAETAS